MKKKILELVENIYILLFVISAPNKKKLCCCFALLAEQLELRDCKEARAAIRATKGLLDVLFIQRQEQPVIDKATELFEHWFHRLESESKINNADYIAMLTDFNSLANSIPIK